MKQLKLLFTVLFLAVLGLGNVWGADVKGTIKFGTNDVKINAASVNGDDDLGNSWTITTAGTTSFTTNAAYYQVGSSSKPATSITFTTTLPASKKITAMSAKFGGFSGTAGTVTLKVGENSIGTGSLDATTDVTVTSTDATKSGTVLTVTVTGIAKGVKVYNISYTYDDGTTSSDPVLESIAVKTAPTTIAYTEGQKFNPAGLVITKTMSDATTGDVAYAGNESDFTFAPALTASLATTDTKVTITYGGKSVDQAITVGAFAPTAGEYEIALNNVFFNCNAFTSKPSDFTSATGSDKGVSIKYVAASNAYINATQCRIYKDVALEFTAPEGFEITSIVLGTSTQNPSISADAGTLSDRTWTGNATSVTLKGTQSTGNYQVASVTVTYAAPATLQSITVSGAPTKKEYIAGENFNPAGLTVTGNYSDESHRPITEGITWSTPAALTAGQTSVEITATALGMTSAAYEVTGLTVSAAKNLDHIALNTESVKKEFWKGETFNYTGLVVTAYYDDDTHADVEPLSVSTPNMTLFNEAQTITVSYKEGGVTKEATYEIEVKTIANTQETAYTTTEAIAIIEAGKDLTSEVYVKGKVSQVDSYNSTYKSITYWLDGNSFEVYSGKGLEGADFAAVDDIAVNADVIIKGIIKKYNSTYEFDKNNVLVSYEAPEVVKENPTLTISGNKTAMSADDDDNEFTVSYDGDGELSVTSSDEAVAEAVIIDNTVVVEAKAAGTTTITVSAAETATHNAVSKAYTLKVSAGLSAAALPFNFDGGKTDMNVANGIKNTGLGSGYSASPKLQFDGTGDEVIIRVAEAIKKVEYTIKGAPGSGAWSGQFDVLQSADGKTYTTLASHTSMATTATEMTSEKPAAETRYIKFVLTTKTNGNVALGAIKIIAASELDSPELAFGQESYTFFADAASMQVTATSAAGSTGAITYALTAGDADAFLIDENTGDIVCETAGTYTVTATIAAAGEYDTQSVNVVVTINEPEDLGEAISIVFPYGETFYAMKKDLSVVEVIYANNKLINVAEADKADLTWYKKVTGENVTFRNAEGKYLGTGASNAIALSETAVNWTLSTDGTYYCIATANTRTFLLKDGETVKNYAVSNASSVGYSKKPVFATGFGSGNVVCGTNIYETLAEAIAAEDGGTINVLVDLNENIVIPAGKTFALDLNGHTLNGAQTASTATIKNLGTLTIENGTILRSGAGSASYYIIENEGTMTLNCNVSGSASSSLIRNNAAEAKMTFEGGEYTQTGAFIVVKNDLGEVIINDGTFTTDAAKNVLNNWDQMTINGGTFNGCILNGAYDTNDNTLTINDGTFNTDKIRTYLGNGQTDANIEIKGGEFTSENLVYQGPTSANDAQVAISGGTFHTAVPAIYCAEDFQPLDNGDGTYGVQEAIKVASIVLGGEYAQSFTVGDEFAFAGTVTAKYNREKADAVVTSDATFTGYDMNTLGKQTVTVSYTEDDVTVTATYEITVKANPATLTEETVNFAEACEGTTSGTALASTTAASFTITYAQNGATNAPTYYYSASEGDKVHTYVGNTITISATKNIYMVEVSYVAGNTDKGMTTVANNNHGYIVCDGTTSELTMTATVKARITNITVYYEDQKEEVRDGLSVGKFGTICVEKMTLAPAGAHFYTLNQYNEAEQVLTVTENTTGRLEAGVPYIFEAEGAEIAGIVVANAKEASDANGLYAVLGSDYYADGSEFGIVGNEVRPAAAGALFRAGRCYIKLNEVSTTGSGSAPARAFRVISGTNNATGLEGLEAIEGAVKVLYNGQIVILRDGKTYDVTGKVVK